MIVGYIASENTQLTRSPKSQQSSATRLYTYDLYALLSYHSTSYKKLTDQSTMNCREPSQP